MLPAAARESLAWGLRESFERHAALPALEYGERTWTYAELEQECLQLALRTLSLMGQGVVAIDWPLGPELVVATLACALAGQVYLHLDPAQPPLLNARLRTLSRAGLQWGPAGLQPLGPGSALPDGAWSLVYTSGSQGLPRGYLGSGKAARAAALFYGQLLDIGPGDRLALLTSARYAAYSSILCGGLLNGACLCPYRLADHGQQSWWQWFNQRRISHLHTVPTVFRELLRQGPSFPHLRTVRLGGEPLWGSDVALANEKLAPGCRLIHGLSQTETGGIYAYYEIDRQFDFQAERVPAGYPCPDVTLELRGEEIWVDTPRLALLEWPDKALPRPWNTGDLGFLDAAGRLFHLGRSDRTRKIRGQRICLDTVERALLELPGVEHCRTDIEQEILTAFVHPRIPPDWSVTLRALLPSAAIPGHLYVVDDWPLQGNGKPDLRNLRSRVRPRPSQSAVLPSGDEWERWILEEISRLLGRPIVNLQADFFELGGDSLTAAQLVDSIEQRFGQHRKPTWVLTHPRLEQMASHLRGEEQASTPEPKFEEGQLLWLQTGPRPLWVIPGGSASEEAFKYRNWCALSGWDRGLASWILPLNLSLECLLQWMTEHLKEHQEIQLVGDCLGAPIAHLLAVKLEQRGHRVELTLINPRRSRSLSRRLRQWLRWLPAALRALFQLLHHPYPALASWAYLRRALHLLREPQQFRGNLLSPDYRARRERLSELVADCSASRLRGPCRTIHRTRFWEQGTPLS